MTVTENIVKATISENLINLALTSNNIEVIKLGEVVMTNTQDHTLLQNIGTKTHAEIDTELGLADRIRVVNSNPLTPDEGDICLNITDDKLYIAMDL